MPERFSGVLGHVARFRVAGLGHSGCGLTSGGAMESGSGGDAALPALTASDNARVASQASSSEILPGVWRFVAPHPDWTPDDGGEDGWERDVAWWAVATAAGLVLVDPLVEDWVSLDDLIAADGGCAAVIRTIHWHERTIAQAALRYHAEVWAKPLPADPPTPDSPPFDRAIIAGEALPGGLLPFAMERSDEVALWLPDRAALIFGDAMLRTSEGTLEACPASWLQPEGGPARLRELLRNLTDLPVEHVLVAHGPLVLGGGLAALRRAVA